MNTKELHSTGIEGLDAFIGGGLPRNRLYLVEGDPGVGKTTLALQFLLEGARQGEKVLLVSLAESEEELEQVAQSQGWDLGSVTVCSLAAMLALEEDTSVLLPSEVELGETMARMFAEVKKVQPDRVVVDSLSEIRLLAQNPLRYRRQMLAMKHFFLGCKCTVLLLDDRTGDSRDLTLQSLVHGVIDLQRHSPIYGKARRKIQVVKLRGVDFQAGYHDFKMARGGIQIFPRLVASTFPSRRDEETVSSGSAGLDEMLGGGLDRGTSTLVIGPAGCGKTSICVLFAVVQAERGVKGSIFLFDEGLGTLLKRAAAINMDLKPFIDQEVLHVRQINPAEMSPGEFMSLVRREVEEFGAGTIVIDSLTGYFDAMPESQFLTIQMFELLSYLNRQGIISLLTLSQHGYLGSSMQSPVDISYLADTVILLRFFEAAGEVKKAISIVKKRTGEHETAIREYRLGSDRLNVGRSLKDFHGVLTGVPTYTGSPESILAEPESLEHG